MWLQALVAVLQKDTKAIEELQPRLAKGQYTNYLFRAGDTCGVAVPDTGDVRTYVETCMRRYREHVYFGHFVESVERLLPNELLEFRLAHPNARPLVLEDEQVEAGVRSCTAAFKRL